jgi:hypothetical protein
MQTKDYMFMGIAGAALYYLYEKGYLASFGLVPTTAVATTTTTSPQAAAQSAATTTVLQQMINLASKNNQYVNQGGLLTYDQWSYFYTQVRGVGAPVRNDLASPPDINKLMTLQEWYALVSNAAGGLQGIAMGNFNTNYIRSGGGANWFESARKIVM